MLNTIKNVLVVEDEAEAELRNLIIEELEDLTPFRIIPAKDGYEAYQKARNQKFDAVLTDFKMPRVEGNQLINALRESNINYKVPILIYTGVLEEAERTCSTQKDVQFLTKPAASTEIAEILKSMVQKGSVPKAAKKKVAAPKTKFKLDVDFVNPFIDSAITTLTGLCVVRGINPEKVRLKKNDAPMDTDISGSLAITSPNFQGNIAVSFNYDVFIKVLSAMLEEEISDINSENEDGAAEIINIIFGQTKAVLNSKGYELERAIPSVVKGHNHNISSSVKIPTLVIPIGSDLGTFFIQICVKAI